MGKEFTYNTLTRAEAEIKIVDVDDKEHVFKLHEFSKKNLEDYVEKIYTYETYEDQVDDAGNKVLDDKGQPRRRLKKFADLCKTQTDSICEFLAKSAGKGFDKTFFTKLVEKLTMRQFASLFDMLNELNDVQTLLDSLGNLAMLPMISKNREQEAAQTSSE